MRIRNLSALGLLLTLLWMGLPAVVSAQQPLWADEFEGPAGAAPDAAKWAYDLGASGWGNAEWQEYTARRENSFLNGKGHLVIRALREGEKRFTSARLVTRGNYTVTYGRIEGRMKLPFGQGIWPAFWMLGEDIAKAGWPRCGEIDIMENVGKEPGNVYGTLHGPGYSGGKALSGKRVLPAGQRYAEDFHVYAVDWRQDRIRFLVDGVQFHEVRRDALPEGSVWVFDKPHYLLLNLAVGGHWPGYPDATTTFPQELVVDWVRVYR